MEDEADFQDVDPTFVDKFVRGLGVLCPVVDMTINDDWRPPRGGGIPVCAIQHDMRETNLDDSIHTGQMHCCALFYKRKKNYE